MDFAVQLADALLARFEDEQNGGFFFTSHDHEALIQRNKTGQDNATPSGNGIAAQGLLRLAELTGDTRYAEAAERCLKLFFPVMQKGSQPIQQLVHGAGSSDAAVFVAGAVRGKKMKPLLGGRQSAAGYMPELMIIALTCDETNLPAPLRKPRSSGTTAWLCHGTQCLPPITDLGKT